ncbi:MAG: hypothetical protein KIS66_09270 [Fimbriimonadaceae bacterium]|nr:hypothetical protein [Fimbriimonadaceae bacterium]
MNPVFLLGWSLLLLGSRQDASHLPVAILAPESDANSVRALLKCETPEALRAAASERGYEVLDGQYPYRLVHEDFLENSQYVLAQDLMALLKGFDPNKAIQVEDLPSDLRRRLEPLLRKRAGRESDSRPLFFSLEPYPNIGVENPKVTGRLNPPPDIRTLVPSWRSPAMHPLSPGYSPRRDASTVPNANYRPRVRPERHNVDRTILAFGNPQNDQMRVRWAQSLWKAVAERTESQRQAYVVAMRAESYRILNEYGALQGFLDGKAPLSAVSPTMRQYAEERLWGLGIAIREDLGLVLQGGELAVVFEDAPHTYTSVGLGGILGLDGGFPR